MVLSLKFNKKTEEKINNEVSNEYIASYFDGEYQTEIPGKDDGYVVDKIVCDNGATATWDNEDWGINIRNATQKIKCSIYFNFKTEYDFDYTGTEQSFMVPKSGKYKLETWGAQGGSHSEEKHGGYGGYSVGTITLLKSDILYLNIGGSGKVNDKLPGKFTKGGYYGGGGGATSNKDSSGGGGSGYIGNSLLTNKAMYCYNCEESNEESTKTISTTCAEETPTANCAKKGNGYARITYIN